MLAFLLEPTLAYIESSQIILRRIRICPQERTQFAAFQYGVSTQVYLIKTSTWNTKPY